MSGVKVAESWSISERPGKLMPEAEELEGVKVVVLSAGGWLEELEESGNIFS